MEILYDDEYITVCIKEPMMLSQESASEANMITALNEYYRENMQNASAYPIHRLDRGVGGVMVFAKSSNAAAKLSSEVAAGKLGKEYLAIVCGKPEADHGIYEDLLFKDSAKNRSYVVTRKRAGVRDAKLEYRLMSTMPVDEAELSLVKIKLLTGRSHQIRVQFSHRKLPLYGDRRYGARLGSDIALWSYRLVFKHPKTGVSVEFSHLPNGGTWEHFHDILEAVSQLHME